MSVAPGKPGYFGKGSVEVGPKAEPGQTRARRITIAENALSTQPLEGIDTVYDILAYSSRTHASRNAAGARDIVGVHEEEKEIKKVVDGKETIQKKKWQFFELSEFKYITYTQLKEQSDAIGKGLADIGLKKGDIFNIYAGTSINWQIVAFACSSISVTIATAYDTLGESGLTHSLNEPDCAGVYTNADLLPVLCNVLGNTTTIKFIVYDGTAKPAVLEKLKAVREGLTILTLDEVRKRGEAITLTPEEAKARLPKPEDIHCIMYTSGSTGAPKGVVLTHGNLIAGVGGVYKLLAHNLKQDDTFLAFLPLAHILEYIVEVTLLFVGMTFGYGKIKTLTDGSVRNCKGDIREFKPSVMVGVPAVWETIRKGILTTVNAGGALKQTVFNGSVKIKKAGVPGLSQLVDSVVLSKIKAATGGRLRLALSGGSAMSRETHEFLNTVLVTVLQGYGMTESCGMCAILPPELMSYGNVGLPVPCVEIKFLDVPEAGYLSTNNPPQGEVCIRGPSVTKGYYRRPDLNEDPTIFTEDGWLRTGDVGQWNPNGTLSVIDRIKNLIKLSSGEYIALERLETTYKSCNLVHNICVYGNENARQPMAIIIPHEAQLRQFLQAQAINGVNPSAPLEELCHNEAVRNAVLAACNAAGKKTGFKPLEMLETVVLTPEEWTPESGLVTAAQKLQRKKILETFKSEVKKVYDY